MAVVENPVMALISAIVPGGGQVAKGQFLRAFLIWVLMIVGMVAFVVPGVIVYFWQIYDAGR